MAKTGKTLLRGGFPAGTKVGLYEAIGDTFIPSLPRVGAYRTVKKDSTVEFDNLEEGKPYFIAGEVDGEFRVRRVTGKPAAQVSAVPLRPPRRMADGTTRPVLVADQEQAASLRFQQESAEIRTGMQTTKRVRGHDVPVTPLAIEHVPDSQARQDGVKALGEKGAPKELASDTIAGQAFEATPPGGRLQQDEVPEGTPQASSTELGDAAIIVDVKEPKPGDHDPSRASGDSAVGPAGTVSPANQGDKSTSRLARDAEARSKAAQKGARTKRRQRAAKKPAPNRGERSTSRAESKGEARKQSTAKSRGRS